MISSTLDFAKPTWNGRTPQAAAGPIWRRAFGRLLLIGALAGLMLPASLIVVSPARATAVDEASNYQLDAAHDGDASGTALTLPLSSIWSDKLSASGPVSYPLIANGIVYVTEGGAPTETSLNYGTTLYALDAATGATLWTHPLGGSFWWSGIAYDAGRVFALNENGVLTAFDAQSGTIDWTEQLIYDYSYTSVPTASRGILYIGGSGYGGTLYALSETDGHTLWAAQVDNGDGSSPAVDDSSVYVTYEGPQDYSFDRIGGELHWQYDGGSEGGGGMTPVVAGDYLYDRSYSGSALLLAAGTGQLLGPLGSAVNDPVPAVAGDTEFELDGRTLYANSNYGLGASKWSFVGDGGLDTAPVVVGGLVFVGSSSGELYGLEAGTGGVSWSANVGEGFVAPNEFQADLLPGIAAGEGLLVAAAGGSLDAYAPAGDLAGAPAASSAPHIDGTIRAGAQAAVDVGVWSGLPSSYAYQWQSCDGSGANCSAIPGATTDSYTPSSYDLGTTLRVKVTAANAVGSTTDLSGASNPVLEATPVNVTKPSFNENPVEGTPITVNPGTWNPTPASFDYVWYVCPYPGECSSIPGATSNTYVPSASDVDYQLVVEVTPVDAGGPSTPAHTPESSFVAPASSTTTTTATSASTSTVTTTVTEPVTTTITAPATTETSTLTEPVTTTITAPATTETSTLTEPVTTTITAPATTETSTLTEPVTTTITAPATTETSTLTEPVTTTITAPATTETSTLTEPVTTTITASATTETSTLTEPVTTTITAPATTETSTLTEPVTTTVTAPAATVTSTVTVTSTTTVAEAQQSTQTATSSISDATTAAADATAPPAPQTAPDVPTTPPSSTLSSLSLVASQPPVAPLADTTRPSTSGATHPTGPVVHERVGFGRRAGTMPHDLTVTLRCSTPCRADVTVTAPLAAGAQVTLGAASRSLPAGRTRQLVIPLVRGDVAAYSGRHHALALTVHTVARGTSGPATRVTRRLKYGPIAR